MNVGRWVYYQMYLGSIYGNIERGIGGIIHWRRRMVVLLLWGRWRIVLLRRRRLLLIRIIMSVFSLSSTLFLTLIHLIIRQHDIANFKYLRLPIRRRLNISIIYRRGSNNYYGCINERMTGTTSTSR